MPWRWYFALGLLVVGCSAVDGVAVDAVGHEDSGASAPPVEVDAEVVEGMEGTRAAVGVPGGGGHGVPGGGGEQALKRRVAELEAHITSDHAMLSELHRRLKDPALMEWIRKRKNKLAQALYENPETHAMLESVHKVGQEDLGSVEKFVEKEIGSYVGMRYAPAVAWILSLTILSLPLMVSFYGLMRVSQRLSVRQFILVGNFVNMMIALLLCIVGGIARRDPLAALQAVSSTNFVVVQLLVTLVFLLFCFLLGSAISLAESSREKDIFVAQLCFYVLLAVHYKSIIWSPAMLGEKVAPLWLWYPTYAGVFLAMTFLTAVVGAINSRSQSIDLENNGEKHE